MFSVDVNSISNCAILKKIKPISREGKFLCRGHGLLGLLDQWTGQARASSRVRLQRAESTESSVNETFGQGSFNEHHSHLWTPT